MPRTYDQMKAAGLKPVRLELPEGVQDLLRVEAARNRMSMARYARHLVEVGLGVTKDTPPPPAPPPPPPKRKRGRPRKA